MSDLPQSVRPIRGEHDDLSGVFETPFFDGSGSLSTSDVINNAGYSFGNGEYPFDSDSDVACGLVKAREVTIDEDLPVGDMLAIFATESITVEGGVEIDGGGMCEHDDGVYGEGGKYDSDEWITHAYHRCTCEEKLIDELGSGISFDDLLVGGGSVGEDNGGATLLLAAPRVELQAPMSVDVTGEGDGNDGHFGVIYEDQFVFDDAVETNGSAVVRTAQSDEVTSL